MTCLDFEHAWMSRLDRDADVAIVESAEALAHLSLCSTCRSRVEVYQAMERAPMLGLPRPEPSTFFVARLTREVMAAEIAMARKTVPRWAIGLAATLVAAAGLTLWWRIPQFVPPTPVEVVQADASSLPETLTLASAATIEFMRETSSPAATLGAVVLQSTSLSRQGVPASADPAVPASSEVLQSMSSRVESGMKPLTGSARKAFNFLLGPVVDADQDQEPPNHGA